MSESATYTHLRDGSWGVRFPGTARESQAVTVTKIDGSTKTETIAKVLWTGRDSKSGQTISLCSIAQGGNGHSTSGARTCPDCGTPVHGKFRYCYDCGMERRDGGSMAHGGQSYYDRNGNFVLGDDD